MSELRVRTKDVGSGLNGRTLISLLSSRAYGYPYTLAPARVYRLLNPHRAIYLSDIFIIGRDLLASRYRIPGQEARQSHQLSSSAEQVQDCIR
jgi:hypothetical protein